MGFESLLFWVAGALAVIFAFTVVLAKNPVHSAIALVANFVMLAVEFMLLHAEFIAIVEVLVYAGAVMVLFLFVVTLLMASTKQPEEEGRGRLRMQRLFAGVLAAALVLVAGDVVLNLAHLPGARVATSAFGSISAFGSALFTRYLLPFELTALVLLVAVIGVVVLGRDHG